MPEALASVPVFGEPPKEYVRPPSYEEVLGPDLFKALCEYYTDGISVINTHFGCIPGAANARLLFEELRMEVDVDPETGRIPKEIADDFIRAICYRPVYQSKEPIKANSLEDYSKKYVLAALQPAPTHTGTQIGLPGKVITTGPNRFNPSSPEGLTITEIDPETGEITQKQVELASFFYWDAEPAIEALLDMGRFEDVIEVLNSYAYYCEHFGGDILNWNNTSVDRSQPPMFFRMVAKAAEYMGDDVLIQFLKPMVQHFSFWQDGMNDTNKLGHAPGSTYRRTGRLAGGEVALHNFDDSHDHTRPDNPIDKCGPRPEMKEQDEHDLIEYEKCIDCELTDEERCDFFNGIFSAAETGLDFTDDQADEDGRLITHRLINPALNAMYAEGASVIARAWRIAAEEYPDAKKHAIDQALLFEGERERVWRILQTYNYNKEDKMFGTYDFVKGANGIDLGRRRAWSLNGAFVLSSGMTDKATAWEVLDGIDENFLRPGGLLAASRYFESNRQWDGKASWPILVRECIKGAIRYERYDLAIKWLEIHIESNLKLFETIGHLGEKNASHTRGVAIAIGEYGPQDITMSYAVHLWMVKMLNALKLRTTAQAIGSMQLPRQLTPA